MDWKDLNYEQAVGIAKKKKKSSRIKRAHDLSMARVGKERKKNPPFQNIWTCKIVDHTVYALL